MTASTVLLPGVRLRPNGASFEVRIRPFPPRAGFATADEANQYALLLRARKRQGILVPPPSLSFQTTLRELAEAHLQRLHSVGGRKGVPYTPDGLAKARAACRPWLGESVSSRKQNGAAAEAPPALTKQGKLFADLPLAALSVADFEQYLERRASNTPRAAVSEYQALRSILKLARRRGETFDHALFEIDPVRRRSDKRSGLRLHELRFLASYAQEEQRRLFLLGGTLGSRISELLLCEDGWLDLDSKMLTVPAWATKEKREKRICLLDSEVTLFREQMLARSPKTVRGRDGSRLLFPRRHGTPWGKHSGFWNRVVVPTRRKAARAWRIEHGLPVDAPTPFEWTHVSDGEVKVKGFAPHDLRRSAADLLRDLEVSPEVAAARFGHKDGGHLLLTTYRSGHELRQRAELDALSDEGIDARLARLGLTG